MLLLLATMTESDLPRVRIAIDQCDDASVRVALHRAVAEVDSGRGTAEKAKQTAE